MSLCVCVCVCERCVCVCVTSICLKKIVFKFSDFIYFFVFVLCKTDTMSVDYEFGITCWYGEWPWSFTGVGGGQGTDKPLPVLSPAADELVLYCIYLYEKMIFFNFFSLFTYFLLT